MRWAERQSAYQHFYQAFVFITEALELLDTGNTWIGMGLGMATHMQIGIQKAIVMHNKF